MKYRVIMILMLFSVLKAVPSIYAQTQAPPVDLAVIQGNDPYVSTFKALESLGGMNQFVKPGMKVGLLINSGFEEKGAYVNPDVAIAVIRMCFDAGASEVVCLQHVIPDYWHKSTNSVSDSLYLTKIRTIEKNHFPSKFDSIHFVVIDSAAGSRILRRTEVVKEVFEVDVFINIPILKHHATTLLTGAMKNMMGLITRACNVKMHLNGPKRNDPVFLAQSITEIFQFRKPDLYVADFTEVITTNGPAGPGEMARPGKVLAGRDPVLMDAYAVKELNWVPEDVPTLKTGVEANLGNADLSKAKILEIRL